MNNFTTEVTGNRKKMVLGTVLTVLWTAGLLAVLESDSLILQISILLLLGPVSVALDNIVSTILRNQRATKAYSNQELEAALSTKRQDNRSLWIGTSSKLSTLTLPRYVGS
jgi:hypothetical protein